MFTARYCLTALAILLTTGSAVAAASLEQQRVRFLEALAALEQQDGERFMELSAQLHEYPLYPYLAYWQLARGPLPSAQVKAFLARHGELPITIPLREQWLRRLANEQHWQEYAHEYRPSNKSELRCHYHYAQLQSGAAEAAWAGANKLWLSGERQDRACIPLFDAWEQAGGLTPALRRQRVELLLKAGNVELARYVAAPLPEADRRRVELWQQVRSRPGTVADEISLREDNAQNRELVIFGVQRLARSDAGAAAKLWQQVAPRYRFSTNDRHTVLNTLALWLALRADVSALDWFAQIPAQAQHKSSREWAVRVALRHQRWADALAILQAMPDDDRRDEEWQYWTARSLEALGDTAAAQRHYHTVAGNRSYYGFLAADRLDVGYNLTHEPVIVEEAALRELAKTPAVVRAYELLQVGLGQEARREWEHAIRRMTPDQRLTAGKLASQWNWYDRAALTLAKANYYDDLDIRFPLAFTDAVIKEAEANTLDPAWVFAVARQESVMMPDARSPVGALGLMQLMPATGREIARKLTDAVLDLQQLLVPETNIRFGTYYLRELSDQFSDHKALVTAAYNAGPHRVVRWAPPETNLDADIWVDNIPYNETRKYVRRVLAYSVFYDQRLEKDIVRLRERMPPVRQ